MPLRSELPLLRSWLHQNADGALQAHAWQPEQIVDLLSCTVPSVGTMLRAGMTDPDAHPLSRELLSLVGPGQRDVSDLSWSAALAQWLCREPEARQRLVRLSRAGVLGSGLASMLAGLSDSGLATPAPGARTALAAEVARLGGPVTRMCSTPSAGGSTPIREVAGAAAAHVVGAVSPAPRVAPALAQVNAANLLYALSYGTDDLVTFIKQLPEASPLGRCLRPPAAAGGTLDGAELLARFGLLLWRFRNQHATGQFDFSRFAATYGEPAAELLTLLAGKVPALNLARPNYAGMAEVVDAVVRVAEAKEARAFVDALVRHDRLIPKRVPALDRAAAAVPAARFAGQGLCAVQHLFPTLVATLEKYMAKGMAAQDIYLLGTPYANNPLVVSYLRLLGVRVQKGTDVGLSTLNFEQYRLHQVSAFLTWFATMAVEPPNGWVVLDDGGMLNGLLTGVKRPPLGWGTWAALRLPQIFTRSVHGVEETTRGLTELGKASLSYPVVAVGSSTAKKEEGILFGWSLAVSFLRELRKQVDLTTVRRLTVVSAGSLGAQAAKLLQAAGFDVDVVDTDPDKVAGARALGLRAHGDLAQSLRDTQAILSVTGMRAINPEALGSWHGFVASGSSAAIECDTDLLALSGSRAQHLNMGRPVNFTGDGHELLSPEQVGLEQALLFLGAAQCMPAGAKGLVALDDQPQADVLAFWRSSGGDRVGDVLAALPPIPPRPDSLSRTGRASPSEWETYFQSFAGHVVPAPDRHPLPSGVYFFAEPGGEVRVLDSRTGASFVAGLEEMPLGLAPRDCPAPGHGGQHVRLLLLSRDENGGPVTRKATLGPAGLELGETTPTSLAVVSRLVARAPSARTLAWAPPGDEGDFTQEIAFTTDRGLWVMRENDEVVEIPCDTSSSATYVWPAADVIVQLGHQPARAAVFVLPPATGASAWTDFRLPSAMKRVLSVSQGLDGAGTREPFIIGLNDVGQTLITAMHPHAGPPVVLPRGATLRGLVPSPDQPGHYQIHFSRPGRPDEPEEHGYAPVLYPAAADA